MCFLRLLGGVNLQLFSTNRRPSAAGGVRSDFYRLKPEGPAVFAFFFSWSFTEMSLLGAGKGVINSVVSP